MSERKPVSLILTGPTGIGKTEIAVQLAQRRPFELISADSMQVYRGMEIGTGQPTPKELCGVPIHGCGMIAPDQPFSAKQFIDFCDEAHRRVISNGRIPIYVGGTGLYLRALRWGLFEEEAGRAEVRQRLTHELERLGPEALHRRLTACDPTYAARVAVKDGVRIVRALEVLETTGRPMSEMQMQWDRPVARFPHKFIVLICPRGVLVRRIEDRVEAMLAAGWIEEVKRLLGSGFSPRLHAFKALGYREVIQYLDGSLTMEELRTKIKAATRQFAKRQMTWFRKEREAQWLNYNGVSSETAVGELEKILDS